MTLTADTETIRFPDAPPDYRFPIPPVPNGWFQVAYSDELPVNGVMPLQYFGQHLVLFRDGEGVARVLDAFCPHLGAHLVTAASSRTAAFAARSTRGASTAKASASRCRTRTRSRPWPSSTRGRCPRPTA
jgi:hypothetical protein